MKTSAFVLRAHTNGDTSYMEGAVIDLPTSQFMDFKGIEPPLVREATKAEIAASKKAPEAE